MTPPIVLTVGAHDPLGGAGVAADIATFAALGVHGVVAITAVTAQRFGSVDEVRSSDADFLAAQLDGITGSFRVDAMKVGLVLTAAQVEVIATRIEEGRLPRPVVDPVMVDGRGGRIVADEVEAAIRERLCPLARVLTPNRAEAALLADMSAELIAGLGADVVIVTGADGRDLIIGGGGPGGPRTEYLDADRVDTVNVRGSGCTFSAAIAGGIGRGVELRQAVEDAKAFVGARLVDGAEWRLAPAGEAGPISHLFAGDQGMWDQPSP